MGYTHYWSTDAPVDPADWRKLTGSMATLWTYACTWDGQDVGKLPPAGKVALSSGDGTGYPRADKHRIEFNGNHERGEDYETFYLTPGLVDFDFCKTNHRPYDVIVCVTLLRATELFGETFRPRSDGDWDSEGWRAAREMYRAVFNTDPECPW